MDVDDEDDTKISVSKAEYDKLVEKVDNFARTIESLLLENQELRTKCLSMDDCNNLADESPRKIPKTNGQHVATDGGAVFVNNFKNKKKQNDSFPSNNSQSDTPSSSVKVLSKKNKVFQVIGNNAVSVRNNMLNAGCKDFVVKQYGGKAPVKINVTANEAEKVRNTLLSNKSSFHEYKLPEEKCSCFIIKGLVGISEADLDEIKTQLIERGLPENILLSLYTTAAMRANAERQKNALVKLENALVKLVLPPNFKTSILHQIKSLNYVAIKFEEFKAKNIMQCRNCQRFGHASTGCKHPHRCVKCGEDHLKDACRRSVDKNVKLYCCNCGGEHTANNLAACSYFIELVAKKQAAVNNVVLDNDAVAKRKSSHRRPEVSFSDVINAGRPATVGARASEPKQHNLESKIDKLISMVFKHEKLLSRLLSNNV